jgi:DNA-binding MarR family transcriptional regulator
MPAAFDDRQSLFHLASAIARRLAGRLREELKPLGLQPAQFSALCEIERRQGLTQAELAARLMVEQPGVARTLSGLAAEGWIEKASLGKGRAQGLYLSDRARSALPQAREAARRVDAEALSGLSRTAAAFLIDDLEELASERED